MADILAAVWLFAREVDTVAWLEHQCFVADSEFKPPVQQVQHFLACVRQDLRVHRLADRVDQFKSAHLLIDELSTHEVVRVSPSSE